jgi:hypothetical protein
VGLSLGLWAVAVEQRRTAEQRDLAEKNLVLAKQAVDECFGHGSSAGNNSRR